MKKSTLLKVKKDRAKDKKDIFDYYQDNRFDLVSIKANSKIPFEEGWPQKSYKSRTDWEKWANVGLNFGVKTGKKSNLTILDFDSKPIPPEFVPYLKDYRGFLQESTKGFHYAFQYEADLPKTRINNFKLDIENDGGQVVINPSIIDGVERKVLCKEKIPKMSNELKEFIKKNLARPTKEEKPVYSNITFDEKNINKIAPGNRNNSLIRLGGILRKELNTKQTKYVVQLMNTFFVNPVLDKDEITTICRSIEKYVSYDEKEMAQKVIDYLTIVPDNEATERDIREAIGYPKKEIEKALSYLMAEEYIVKKRRMFYLTQKPNWKEEFAEIGHEIKFKFPYFDDIATFRQGDMIIIGAKTGVGKTHIAMNIIKQLIQQGIKPDYASLENGSRFRIIAETLNVKPGTFRWDLHANPEKIELDKDKVTIIDWLLPKDYAMVDKLFEYFSQQLTKNSGILVIFMQLRSDGNFFAKDLVDFFPSFVTKFFYEDDNGERSYFEPTKVREPKQRNWRRKIPTLYNWDDKELRLATNEDEIQQLTGG